MIDPRFTNSGGNLFGTAIERTVRMSQLKREKAVTAYRNNIALPDVHIADRTKDFVPLIVGDDGQPLTEERRRQLMKEAGVKPMFDENGQPTDQTYLTGGESAFDKVIGTERLGETAEASRPGMRVVQPRELELIPDLDEDSVRCAQSGTFVPESSEQQQMSLVTGNCLYTSGQDAVTDLASLGRQIRYAMMSIIKATPRNISVHRVRMAPQTKQVLDCLYTAAKAQPFTDRFYGVPVSYSDKLRNEIRFFADFSYADLHGCYSSVYLHRDLYALWGVDLKADTERIEHD